MNPFLSFWQRGRALFGRRQWEADMAEEMQLHLEGRIEENLAAGLSPDEARYAAQREFGGIEQIKELARDQRRLAWIENFWQDLRFGVRVLRRQLGFTTVAVLTLALGIGATTAIFSVVDCVLLRPLAYPRAHELLLMAETSTKFPSAGLSAGAYLTWQRETTVFTRLAAWTYGPYNLTGEGEPRRVFAQRVTAGYFGTLSLPPELGRDFRQEEETAGHDNVVILSHGLWQDQFGSRASVIGQSIRLDERSFTVIGVMPDRFVFDRHADLYTPHVFTAREQADFAERSLLAVGRLKPGATPTQAREELEILARRLARKSPVTNKGWGILLLPLLDATVSGAKPLLLMLLGAVGFLLLIACVNVANLLLSRATTRQRELAVRVALGASRGRIIRQLLCESLLIAALGGLLGLAVGYGGMALLLAFSPDGLPRVAEISMDGRVLAFACILALGTGLGFGLIPALEATRREAVETLKDGGYGLSDGRRRQRLRSGLVALEIALALILLTGAGLLGRSFIRLQQVDPGFQSNGVFMTNIALIAQKYPSDPLRAAFVDQAVARLAALPGIQAAAFTNHTLPTMGMPRTFFTISGRAPEPMELPPGFYYVVTPGYFDVLGIPLVRGRRLTAQDTMGAPRVVLINAEMARLHFPDTDPIGQHLSVGNGPEVWREIVGIVGDVLQGGPGQPKRAQIYESFTQAPAASTSVVVRTTLPANELSYAASKAIHAIDPDIPLPLMYPTVGALNRGLAAVQFSLFLFSVFAVTALFLAAIGVYGVMTYAVSQRTGEIGVRMALGAQPRDVLRLILRQGARMVGFGLIAGLAGSLAIMHFLADMLYDVSPSDPLTLAVIVVVLSAVAFLACWLPARRATKVEPLVALRHG